MIGETNPSQLELSAGQTRFSLVALSRSWSTFRDAMWTRCGPSLPLPSCTLCWWTRLAIRNLVKGWNQRARNESDLTVKFVFLWICWDQTGPLQQL